MATVTHVLENGRLVDGNDYLAQRGGAARNYAGADSISAEQAQALSAQRQKWAAVAAFYWAEAARALLSKDARLARTCAQQAEAAENRADPVLNAVFGGARALAPENIVARGKSLPTAAVQQARALVKAELKKAAEPQRRAAPAAPLKAPQNAARQAVVDALRALGGSAKEEALIEALASFGAENEDLPRRMIRAAKFDGCIRQTSKGYCL